MQSITRMSGVVACVLGLTSSAQANNWHDTEHPPVTSGNLWSDDANWTAPGTPTAGMSFRIEQYAADSNLTGTIIMDVDYSAGALNEAEFFGCETVSMQNYFKVSNRGIRLVNGGNGPAGSTVRVDPTGTIWGDVSVESSAGRPPPTIDFAGGDWEAGNLWYGNEQRSIFRVSSATGSITPGMIQVRDAPWDANNPNRWPLVNFVLASNSVAVVTLTDSNPLQFINTAAGTKPFKLTVDMSAYTVPAPASLPLFIFSGTTTESDRMFDLVNITISGAPGGGTNAGVTQTGSNVTFNLTLAGTPPAWIAGWPKVSGAAGGVFIAHAKIDDDGAACYVVVPNNAAAPSAAQVRAGQDSSGSPALKSGSIALAADTENTATVIGLNNNTHYDVYLIAENANFDLQASPVKVDVFVDYLSWDGEVGDGLWSSQTGGADGFGNWNGALPPSHLPHPAGQWIYLTLADSTNHCDIDTSAWPRISNSPAGILVQNGNTVVLTTNGVMTFWEQTAIDLRQGGGGTFKMEGGTLNLGNGEGHIIAGTTSGNPLGYIELSDGVWQDGWVRDPKQFWVRGTGMNIPGETYFDMEGFSRMSVPTPVGTNRFPNTFKWSFEAGEGIATMNLTGAQNQAGADQAIRVGAQYNTQPGIRHPGDYDPVPTYPVIVDGIDRYLAAAGPNPQLVWDLMTVPPGEPEQDFYFFPEGVVAGGAWGTAALSRTDTNVTLTITPAPSAMVLIVK